jgi:hypothetical protein
MDSVQGTRALPRVGFPIRKSPDQSSFSSSPGLIAAAHVLHRLLVPRHPPCALILLIYVENTTFRYAVFKVHGEVPGTSDHTPVAAPVTAPRGRRHDRRGDAGLSKLNSVKPELLAERRVPSVDVVPGVPLKYTDDARASAGKSPTAKAGSTSARGTPTAAEPPYP